MSVKTFPTFDKTHATTVVATAPIKANRLVSFNGTHAKAVPEMGNGDLVIGVSETDAAIGEAFAATTGYSALVEAGAAIPRGVYVCPAQDSSGRVEQGGLGLGISLCGIARTAATAPGQLIEVVLLPHITSGLPEGG